MNGLETLQSIAGTRPGYYVKSIPMRGQAGMTHYLLSHKGRAVGAVNVDSSGETVASSPAEARDWYDSDT